MTFIELVRQLRLEVGASGEGPGSVEDARGEHRRLVHFVAEADWSLSSLWDDWHFMWAHHETTVAAGTEVLAVADMGLSARAAPLGDELGRIDSESLSWRQNGTPTYPLTMLAWADYRRMYLGDVAPAGIPCVAARRPDGALALNPAPAANGTLAFEYWRRPVRLENNLDESLIPLAYHRAIVVQAKLYYAEYEDAREMLQPVAGELGEWLQRLESDQLPHGDYRRRSEQAPGAITVVPQ